MHEMIFSPVSYGGLTLKNRIIFAPTSFGLKEEEYIEKIRQIAAGGCAMIIIGDVPAAKGGFGPSLYTKKGMAHYRRLVETAHRYDCRIAAQLHQSDSDLKALIPCIPGVLTKRISMQDLRKILNQATGKYISRMPEKKVRKITASFGDAAQKAAEAGFDMVQIHGDRMCGSFSSTIFNHRTDRYGGSLENRARFAVECITAVRKSCPSMPVDFKLAVRQENPHYGNAGVLDSELAQWVPLLEKAGVTSFHVTLADHSDLSDTIPPKNHPYFSEEGCFLKYCDMVKKYTNLPVTGVGGLTSPDFIERQLESGRIDCAAMSRQLIADPDWPAKVKAGMTDQIHRCVRCNRKCLGGIQAHQGVHCIYEGEKRK